MGMGVLGAGEDALQPYNNCSMSGASSTLEIAYGNLGTRIPKSLHSCIRSLSSVERTWKNTDVLVWQMIFCMFVIQLSREDHKAQHLQDQSCTSCSKFSEGEQKSVQLYVWVSFVLA